jgi:hypothetical protein
VILLLDSWEGLKALTLALLVARVVADDADDALALDDLALRADGLDAGANFHGVGSRRRKETTLARTFMAWALGEGQKRR